MNLLAIMLLLLTVMIEAHFVRCLPRFHARRLGTLPSSVGVVALATTPTSFMRNNARTFTTTTGTSVPNHHHNHHPLSRQLQNKFCVTFDSNNVELDSENEDNFVLYNKSIHSEWNITEMKRQVSRHILRAHKKIGRASQRVSHGKTATATAKEVELNSDAWTHDLNEQRNRLQALNQLETMLSTVKAPSGTAVTLSSEIASLAVALQINDQPPLKVDRGMPKPKGPKKMISSRLPYRRYYSYNNIEIRVGKKAIDNDELSTSRQHRDDADWWMHASGCPGSHVVIRCHNDVLPNELMADAAALAARQSKCNTSTIKVTLTRCRHVVKPPGYKPGLVQLVGPVQTVIVNMKEAAKRFERLDSSVLVN
jgi:predicted ribosome quality control (RQC) complex YloA/Tae2 family protein